MALRHWSFSRIAVVWAVWLLLLLVGILGVLVAFPQGVRVSISPTGARGQLRWMLAVLGGLVLVAPPAIVTYLWYVARLRAWGERSPVGHSGTRARAH